MNRIAAVFLSLTLVLGTRAATQDAVSMDDEPHYSRILANDKCRVYEVNLRRLEETKPVVHEHDWARMTLAGVVEQAWGGTLFSMRGYEDPEGYYVSFSYPIDRVTLRNPRNEPYREMIVEILKPDNSRYQMNDPSLDPFRNFLGPGVDPHVSFITSLTKTSVEILNVQLLSGDSKAIRSEGSGALLVAMTDLDISLAQKEGEPKKMRLDKGEVKWMSDGAAATFKNEGKETTRFVILGMK